ncbi:5-formyltetrahydrofolate cyclo-ligase [Thalassotalea ponticola]|uniref:5-formyltetrahydrofolate cyclo-ligase n=1 Tax=Thalassotalea ponticola TaxID=1523392 RepID=UPI0025B5D588|nr:5-formyltetrahydrofolate cyclo-ligase [Thalassotalea ponticola]MDN3651863.1 5-formyltetrahydrofolate cyclo-ligase [Thalassotalea ponticola]
MNTNHLPDGASQALKTQRQTIRQQVRNQRRSLSAEQQEAAKLAICDRLTAHPRVQSAQHIAVYLANDGELDLSAFIAWCWQHNKQVYLPVIHPFCSGHLLFLQYRQDSPLVVNDYRILEPALNAMHVIPRNQLDVIVTPLVAFDQSNNRLGMGGGFYDRTLSSWHTLYRNASTEQAKQRCQPYPIGVAHRCQQLSQLPIAHWDVPLPEIISV